VEGCPPLLPRVVRPGTLRVERIENLLRKPTMTDAGSNTNPADDLEFRESSQKICGSWLAYVESPGTPRR
jgi:hypothetical protein